jgi:hypothetical protein
MMSLPITSSVIDNDAGAVTPSQWTRPAHRLTGTAALLALPPS